MDWESIIKRGVESDELDYKAAQNWNRLTRVGRAKFARHCMAMANTKGGYVVVGVGEDAAGRPSLLTGLTEEESQSFDPTEIGNFVNRFSDPQIEFTLERPVVDGKQFVVFAIKRFTQLPHVCTGTCEHELLQGVFYIRTADASSRPAYRASEVHALIQRAMRNQRELLGRMIRGLLYENHTSASGNDNQSRFQEELNHSRGFFQKFVHPAKQAVQAELVVMPDAYVSERFTLSELRASAEESRSTDPNTEFLEAEDFRDAYFTNVSLRFGGGSRIWQIYRTGLFHFRSALPVVSGGSLSYDSLCSYAVDAVAFCASFYGTLGLSDEGLRLEVSLFNSGDVHLDFPGSGPADTVCRIPEITVHLNFTAADLIAGIAVHADNLVRRICERFNISEGRHGNLSARIARHLKQIQND
ncbi:MAG: ATP-binding protein [Lentisphaeria bacterium]|nr:ATP-binding protein [Lentisphaeria bacterium]